jgi:ketosteroid isomerase-like protein
MAEARDRVTIVQQLYESFAHGRIDDILTLLDSDVEWSEPENPLNPAAGTRRGHAGFLEWARVGADAEEILTLEPLLRDGLRAPDRVSGRQDRAVSGVLRHVRCCGGVP